MKNLQHKVCIFCAETVKACAAASEHIFCFSKCVAAPRCISMFLKEPATASQRYQYATAFKRKCAADIFVWLLLETFQCFLMNMRLLLKRY